MKAKAKKVGKVTKVNKGTTTIQQDNGADLSRFLKGTGQTQKIKKDQYITLKQDAADKIMDKHLGRVKEIDFDEE